MVNCRKHSNNGVQGRPCRFPLFCVIATGEVFLILAQYKIQALPRDDQSVAGESWPNHDAAYTVIVKELRSKIQKIRP